MVVTIDFILVFFLNTTAPSETPSVHLYNAKDILRLASRDLTQFRGPNFRSYKELNNTKTKQNKTIDIRVTGSGVYPSHFLFYVNYSCFDFD